MSEAERAGASRQDKSERLLAGRYRLGDVLGRGGMGTVWRAEDETLGRTVAVKELRFPSAIDEDEKRRLITRTLREAKAIARIRSNGAVTVFDVVDEDNRPWIVMELIGGKSLAEVIREDGLLTPRRAAEVGLAILDVLQAAHREGILHRDVKPSNVLIDHDGRVVLTDFGIAQVEGDPSITSTGMLVGAPSYISPERARGHKPGPAADLWSLGGLLYASVEGVPPYDKGSAIATLTAVMTEPVEKPKNAGPLENVIYGLLAKDPEQRLDDAGARAMLNEVLSAPAPEKSVPEPQDATKVVAMPPLPEKTSRRGAGGSASGAKKGEEPSERLRGALRSVRKAATSAGAATSAATARAKAAGGSASAGAEGAAKTASPQTGSGTGAEAGPAGGTSAPTTAVNASVPGQTGGSDGKPVNSGAATGAAGAAGRRGGSGSGWPVAPERPARPVPKASLTDVVPLRTLVILAVVVALAVVGTVLAITIGGGDDNGAKGGTGGGAKATASSGTGSGGDKSGGGKSGGKGKSDAAHTDSGDKSGSTSGSTSGSGSDDTANTSSDSDTSSSDDSGSGGKEPGSGSTAVSTYKSGQGFSIGLPKGWEYVSQDAAGARFTGPDGQKLLVGWTSTPKDDPVADWKNQERYMTRSQYSRIRIESVDYRNWNTADWEFTSVDGGTKFHTIDRGFVVNAHQGYALMYTAKDSAWGSALRKSTWATLTGTFQPKK
ncbi:serine/threonine-protein kinase [Streptomyces sp. NPDC021080]|uniref:serine/threonine-protein kinase n=1 Tax=Streptomyces sp. NPDC021080 TaxID=3365110 RepID=UPI0037A05E5D